MLLKWVTDGEKLDRITKYNPIADAGPINRRSIITRNEMVSSGMRDEPLVPGISVMALTTAPSRPTVPILNNMWNLSSKLFEF